MRTTVWTVLLLFCCTSHNYAQNLARVRTTIDTLCSDVFFGRGYTQAGAEKSAAYLQTRFAHIGLQAFGDSYQQAFQFPINLFPDTCRLAFGEQIAAVGRDFLPHPASGSGAASGELLPLHTLAPEPFLLDSALKASDTRGKILLLDAKQEPLLQRISPNAVRKLTQGEGILFLVPALTHSLAGSAYPFPCFYVKQGVLEAFLAQKETSVATFALRNELVPEQTAYNIVGHVRGTTYPDSLIVYTAHYDHLGGIGTEVFFPGANDNASGVAMLLELAHAIQAAPLPYSVAFIAFSAEEAGLVGSRFFTEHPLFPLQNIVALLNLDLFGTGEKGAVVVNGTVYRTDFEAFQRINQDKQLLSTVHIRGETANSDHYFFHKKGVKSFFFYLHGDWPHYHTPEDRPPLPLSGFAPAFQWLLHLAGYYSGN